MYHDVTIVGNLGSDPVLRTITTSGGDVPVCNFNVATNRRWTGSDGQPKEATVWWRISLWRRQAENAAKYLSKGRQVFIVGHMVPNPDGSPKAYTRDDGTAAASYDVQADTIKYLGPAGQYQDVPGAPMADDEPF